MFSKSQNSAMLVTSGDWAMGGFRALVARGRVWIGDPWEVGGAPALRPDDATIAAAGIRRDIDPGQGLRWHRFAQSPGKGRRGVSPGPDLPRHRKESTMRTILAFLLTTLASAVAAATPDWAPIGENTNGNRIFVDKASVKASGGVTSVTFRTELKTPMDTPTGAVTSMRSQMRVNCKDLTAAGLEVVLFEDEAKDLAYARNKAAKIEYLKEPAGSSADLVVKYVCKK
jgi:hypothetical protein